MFHYEDIVTENDGRFRVYCKSYRVHLDAFLGSIYPDAAWLRQHLCAVMGGEILFLWKHLSVSFYSATRWPHFPSYAAIYQ